MGLPFPEMSWRTGSSSVMITVLTTPKYGCMCSGFEHLDKRVSFFIGKSLSFLDRTALAVNSLYRLIARERNVCGKMIEGEGEIRLSRSSSQVSCGVCGKNLAVSESLVLVLFLYPLLFLKFTAQNTDQYF